MEQRFIIHGGKSLKGSLAVKGAKNDALPVLAASLLSEGSTVVENLPLIEDVSRALELLETLGMRMERAGEHAVRLSAATQLRTVLDPTIAKRLRASVLFTGALLTRMHEVVFPHPGGCIIGERPIDIFLKGFAALGATTKEQNGIFHVSAPRGLHGASYFFPRVSVTGTETLLIASTLATGVTVLENAAMEPEVASLAEYLNRCGARISGQGTPRITVEGVEQLGGSTHRVMPDRIETGSFALMAGATRSKLTITACEPGHLDALWAMMQDAGVRIEKSESSVTVDATRSRALKAQTITTHEYPGLATDLQAPAVVFLTQVDGKSLVHETIFEGRLAWTQDLVRMGARIDMADPHRVFVHGPTPLHGRTIESPDIRAGMAFVTAGLVAQGKTELHNVYQIDRGYERLEERLRAVGADIQRIQ